MVALPARRLAIHRLTKLFGDAERDRRGVVRKVL